jgi:hypothetical protein
MKSNVMATSQPVADGDIAKEKHEGRRAEYQHHRIEQWHRTLTSFAR